METTTRQFIIGMIIFGALISGCFTMIALSKPEDSLRFTNANETLSKFDTITENADDISSTIRQTPTRTGALGILNDLAELTLSGLKLIWSSFDTLKIIVQSLGTAIGITLPGWFAGMIISIVGVIIAFSLAAAYFKWWL